MSSFVRRAACCAALLVAAACADRPSPAGPADPQGSPDAAAPAGGLALARLQQARYERLARRLARALGDADFRAKFLRALSASRVREGKVHFQRFLDDPAGPGRRRLADLSGDAEAEISSDLDLSPQIEVYLPVPEHRKAWTGDGNVLVATAERDHDAPVAFDSRGRRLMLDPDTPPGTPVIALGQAELVFATGGPAGVDAPDEPNDGFVDGTGATGGGAGSGTGAGAALTTPGLYMTYARFNSTFEGWLKGSPEFEVHILGQDGSSSAMRSYQCAGESAGAPYEFNMDSKEWSGSVLLFSQVQLDEYKASHPDQGVRVFVVEDDDTRCAIKTDSTSVAQLFQKLLAAYGTLTGGKDNLFSVKTFNKAVAWYNLLKATWSFIQTPDEIVGNAIEDVVAREYFPGANWIVKGENAVTNGAIRLEMR